MGILKLSQAFMSMAMVAFLVYLLLRLLFSCWILPIRAYRKIKKNGFEGPTPSFPLGNITDMKNTKNYVNDSLLRSSAAISHDIHSTVFPYFARWQKTHGQSSLSFIYINKMNTLSLLNDFIYLYLVGLQEKCSSTGWGLSHFYTLLSQSSLRKCHRECWVRTGENPVCLGVIERLCSEEADWWWLKERIGFVIAMLLLLHSPQLTWRSLSFYHSHTITLIQYAILGFQTNIPTGLKPGLLGVPST